MAQRGLGRGLESLIPAGAKPGSTQETVTVPIYKIRASRFQPRIHFNENTLNELAGSIRQQGMIQPLVITPVPGENADEYELIAGERRWRAAKIAGLTDVPVIIKKVTEKEHLQISLIENLQRDDLNPIEEGTAYKRLMEEFSLTQEELSKVLGKGRVVIANTLRLLNLPQELKDAVSNGSISAGHARSLVSIDDENTQREVAQRILNERLTVRELEKIVSDWKGAIKSGKVKLAPRKDPEVRRLEETLQKFLGTKVEIRAKGKGQKIKGFVKISYYTLDDLERLTNILKRK